MRQADHPIDPLFLRRHSPRAMSGEPLPPGELERLFEAARWAPSGGNLQPWRFVVARREQPAFATFLDLLDASNREWCVRAGALLVLCGRTHRTARDGSSQPVRTWAFDCGAAWMSLALQGTVQGLVVHAMGGFDLDRARAAVRVPEGVDVLCMVAVGLPGDPALLPERQRDKEAPSGREPQAAHVFDAHF